MSCTHKDPEGRSLWEIEDRAHMRFRCSGCDAMGYRRLGAARGVRLYRCKGRDDDGKKCKRPAVTRGWHGLVEVFWCRTHEPPPSED